MSIDEVLLWQEQYAKDNFIPIIEKGAAELLYKQVEQRAPKRILEIGTAIGYSGLLMLKASPDSTLVTVDIDDKRLNVAEDCFKKANVQDRVKIIKEDANYLITLLEEKFDFILLDGPKAHYKSMFPHLLQLTDKDSIIFVDDVGYLGLVDNGEYPKHKHRTIVVNMREFLNYVGNLKGISYERVDVGQGVLIVKIC
jgi:caffeoyl-CoA O-methyltransferase